MRRAGWWRVQGERGSRKAQKPREARGSPGGRWAAEGKGSGRRLQRHASSSHRSLGPPHAWAGAAGRPPGPPSRCAQLRSTERLGSRAAHGEPEDGDGGEEGREEGEREASADPRVSRPPVLSEELSGRGQSQPAAARWPSPRTSRLPPRLLPSLSLTLIGPNHRAGHRCQCGVRVWGYGKGGAERRLQGTSTAGEGWGLRTRRVGRGQKRREGRDPRPALGSRWSPGPRTTSISSRSDRGRT